MTSERLIPCIVGEDGLQWADEEYTEGAEVHIPESTAVQLAKEGLVTVPADAFPDGEPDPEATPSEMEAPGEQALVEDLKAEPKSEPAPQSEVITEPLVVRVEAAELKALAPHGINRFLMSEEFPQFLVDKGFNTDHRIYKSVEDNLLILKGMKA